MKCTCSSSSFYVCGVYIYISEMFDKAGVYAQKFFTTAERSSSVRSGALTQLHEKDFLSINFISRLFVFVNVLKNSPTLSQLFP